MQPSYAKIVVINRGSKRRENTIQYAHVRTYIRVHTYANVKLYLFMHTYIVLHTRQVLQLRWNVRREEEEEEENREKRQENERLLLIRIFFSPPFVLHSFLSRFALVRQQQIDSNTTGSQTKIWSGALVAGIHCSACRQISQRDFCNISSSHVPLSKDSLLLLLFSHSLYELRNITTITLVLRKYVLQLRVSFSHFFTGRISLFEILRTSDGMNGIVLVVRTCVRLSVIPVRRKLAPKVAFLLAWKVVACYSQATACPKVVYVVVVVT